MSPMDDGLVRELRRESGSILFTAVVPDEVATRWLERHEAWFDGEEDDVVRVSTELGDVVAKREQRTGLTGSLVRVGARRLRSLDAFHLGHELLEAGLATPEPLACVTAPAGPRACLITRHVEASGPWRFLIGERPDPDPAEPADPATLDELLSVLAKAMARLHAAGFRHRDLKEPNLLVRRDEDGEPEVLWTDLESLARPRVISDATRCRDLARLAMSFASAHARRAGLRADAWPRFVDAYLRFARQREPDRDDVGRFLARTRRWSERRIERNVVKGRPIA